MFHTTFKVRAQLTKAGHARLTAVRRRNCRLCHQALATRKTAWTAGQASVSLYEQYQSLTARRPSDPRGPELAPQDARGTLRRLDRVWQAFFWRVKAGEKPGPSRCKSHRCRWTLEVDNPLPHMLQGTGARLWLRLKGLSRSKLDLGGRALPPRAHLTGIRIVCKPRRGEVHDRISEAPVVQAPADPVGLARGVKAQAVLSNGTVLPLRQPDRGQRQALQQQASRAGKDTRRRNKLWSQHRKLCRSQYQEEGLLLSDAGCGPFGARHTSTAGRWVGWVQNGSAGHSQSVIRISLDAK